ncbi:hypothetical protein HPB51_002771 [Rhipicephalus microplus]|uniref:Chitin-binding type-2 domain-containing protein n=1 Tax=Rhipicephalus microplus TaxID=6941 RepID=A0A9J6D8A0_RHIMP|nr:hypothetical protein HPB51_002771 [Rhipicephalus microplus]
MSCRGTTAVREAGVDCETHVLHENSFLLPAGPVLEQRRAAQEKSLNYHHQSRLKKKENARFKKIDQTRGVGNSALGQGVRKGASCPDLVFSSLRNFHSSSAPFFSIGPNFVILRLRLVREPLPSGSSFVFVNASTTFRCRTVGYFADTDTNCRLYHVCHRVPGSQSTFFYRYSFQCHNKTVFNQATLTCTNPDESLPCEMSKDFYFLHGNELDDSDYNSDGEFLEDLFEPDFNVPVYEPLREEPSVSRERQEDELDDFLLDAWAPVETQPLEEREQFGRRLSKASREGRDQPRAQSTDP